MSCCRACFLDLVVNEFVYKRWHANECQCLFPTISFQSMWKVNGVGVLGHLNVASLNKQTNKNWKK